MLSWLALSLLHVGAAPTAVHGVLVMSCMAHVADVYNNEVN